MTEQDFRKKYTSIMQKAMKLEAEHPGDGGVMTVVSIAVGATISILAGVNCCVEVTEEDKRFTLSQGIKVSYAEGNNQIGSKNIGCINLEYAYDRLTSIDEGLDSVDKAIKIAKEIDREFDQRGWGKNWLY